MFADGGRDGDAFAASGFAVEVVQPGGERLAGGEVFEVAAFEAQGDVVFGGC